MKHLQGVIVRTSWPDRHSSARMIMIRMYVMEISHDEMGLDFTLNQLGCPYQEGFKFLKKREIALLCSVRTH
jgi:hypothetical protein